MSFRIAEKEAKKSTFYKHRLGAVIVKGNRILSTGFNEIRYAKEIGNSTLHAEQAAILKLLKAGRQDELVGASLYVSRFTKAGRLGCSRPCEMCSELIRSVGITRIHYLNESGEPEEMKT